MAPELRIGCSGWNYPHWREAFYPKGLSPRHWLEHYATVFDTVEVNSTFYRLARESAAERWVQQTPPGFIFAVKASRYLTHVRRLRDIDAGIARFSAPLSPLQRARRLGPVLWQLPENFHRDDERLEQALDDLPAGRHCVEFRHPSWFADEVLELLRARGVALVMGDHPERPFQRQELTADFTFLRFHHGHRGRGGNYSDSELDEWAARIAVWRRRVDVFAYFNNDWNTFAIANARGLRRRLERA